MEQRRREGTKLNTLLEIACDKAVVAPTQDEAHPSDRILVVEDDKATRQLSARILTRSGYQVDAVEAGWEALHARN